MSAPRLPMRKIGPNRRQQLRVRLPRRRPPPRRPRAQPVVVCPRPPRVERRARALPDLTHPLNAETAPRRRGAASGEHPRRAEEPCLGLSVPTLGGNDVRTLALTPRRSLRTVRESA